MNALKNENKKSARRVERPTYRIETEDSEPWCLFEESENQSPEEYHTN